MVRNSRLTVTIRHVPDDSGSYVAMFVSPILASTFSVVFSDSVTGAIALHDFADMLHQHFGRSVQLHLDTDLIPTRSKAMDDVLGCNARKQGAHSGGKASIKPFLELTRTVLGTRPARRKHDVEEGGKWAPVAK